jgi:hypothetical protein
MRTLSRLFASLLLPMPSRTRSYEGPSPALGRSLVLIVVAFSTAAYAANPNVVIQWNQAALQGVRDSTLGPPMTARALAIMHTCMYDAWAAYDQRAVGTQLGGTLRQPSKARKSDNKEKAISFAAYRAAVDLFPWDKSKVFDPLMAQLGYDLNDNSDDTKAPSGIGNVACAAVLEFRHHDGANQLGELTSSGIAYADYTGYAPINHASTVPVLELSTVLDPNRWQPLTYFNGNKVVTQSFVGAQFQEVVPFAMSSPGEFLRLISFFGPARYGSSEYLNQAQELIDMSASLTDQQKMIAEYWALGPGTEQPPGKWNVFAQFVSERDHHSIDEDVKMFFVLTNAIFDAGVAAWDAKREFDSVRPVTAVPYLFHGQQIRSWGGPGKGTVSMDGGDWIPYQPSTFPTPPFPEYISGHSTFSAAGATVLALFTGHEHFGDTATFAIGSSEVEPGLSPAKPVKLSWKTFHDAADQAGISRRYGGIHFRSGDLVGRTVGDLVGLQAWHKAQSYFNGTAR